MGYFPLCIDLAGKTVFLLGEGKQIRDKAEKLAPFSPRTVFLSDLTEDDLKERPSLVIVGDMERRDAERISRLCAEKGIPVNVVDVPELCTFFFPSLIRRGDLTVSVSTGGKSPAAAACLRHKIEAVLPDRTEEILNWLTLRRNILREAGILRGAAAAAFELGRPLTDEECGDLSARLGSEK